MPRYVLIDAELNEVAGDTGRFFLRFLRTVAYARGAEVDAGAIDALTPARAAEAYDIVTGDNIGWRYTEHPARQRPAGVDAGYEVYEVPAAPDQDADQVPVLASTADPAVVGRVRAFYRKIAFVSKTMDRAAGPVVTDEDVSVQPSAEPAAEVLDFAKLVERARAARAA